MDTNQGVEPSQKTEDAETRSSQRHPLWYAIIVLVALQIVMLLLLWLGDIGFDRAGRYGFDFGHFLLFSVVYLVALVTGVVCSFLKREPVLILAQLLMPVAIVAWESRPFPHYDAANYQHLVGADMDTVEAELGERGRVTGLETRGDIELTYWYYEGVDIIFSPDGRVLKVLPDSTWDSSFVPKSGSGLSIDWQENDAAWDNTVPEEVMGQ